MIIETPAFRTHLRDAIAATTTVAAPKPACLVGPDGWRYRRSDAPLVGIPGWGPRADGNWRWHHQQLALLDGFPQRAEEIITSWQPDDPVFSWGEHTTALRLKRLVRTFGRNFDDFSVEFRSFLVDLIAQHTRRLLDDVAVSHHNHALDQIYALTLAKRYLPFLDIPEDVLTTRLEVERRHLLSSEGVVTENSPGYQSWIPARVAECQRLLTAKTNTALLQQSEEFTAWITRPDGTWPEFGDTAPGKPVEPALAAPSGRRAFPHAGYAVHRDADSYFALKCGFRSHAHRHADDGTFLLHAFGEDWFIEAGMFGYAGGWERDYARSPQAHNISYRVGANVIRSTTSRRWQRHQSRWGLKETRAGLVCRSFMFDDAVYERTVEFLPGRILLRDSFDTPGTIRTRFHVPEDKIIRTSPGCVTINDLLVIHHDLPAPEMVGAHHTVSYMRYGPAKAIEFTWPAGRTRATFEIQLPRGQGPSATEGAGTLRE